MHVLLDPHAVEFENDVVHLQVSPFGRRLGFDSRDACAGQPAEAERFRSLLVEINVELHAKKPARDLMISYESLGDVAGDADRNREANALVAAGRAGDRGVKA